MPKRTDISSILIIGAGPIVIGQACEFDYSGTQACKALKEEGYRVVLVNSNPATIMTDPDLADATYIEPITPEIVAKIIEKERYAVPGGFALLPTMGGQTALNTALSLRKMGVLEKFDVTMIGATADAIDKAEDRKLFRDAMTKIGLSTPRSHQIKTLDPGARSARRYRPAGHHPAVVHARRHRRRHRLQQGRIHRNRRTRHRCIADLRGADRGIGARLERVRDGGGARQERQLHHRLLHRKRRSDGRAYRRFHHHRAGADADRQGISDHARRLDRGAARDRGGDRRLQRAVRGQSGRRQARRDRDESAGVALLGFGVEGDRVSHCQGRRQACRRLYARRDCQRHHRRRHAGLVRADHRLHRHQNSALCVREISRRRAGTDHLDEVGRRGDGDRAHLCRKLAEGVALARNRPHRLGRDRHSRSRRGRRQERHSRRARHAVARRHPQSGAGDAARHERRGYSYRLPDRSVVPGANPRHRRDGSRDPRQGPAGIGARTAPAQGDGLFRCAARPAHRACRGRGCAAPPCARGAAGVQADRYLRRRIRFAHRVYVFDLRDAV